ncbi:MAG: hypothetical protein M3Y60_13995, partial [Bacteroidota bacterium]|nr:hypothetical protein [Bacteroidota bacterium]
FAPTPRYLLPMHSPRANFLKVVGESAFVLLAGTGTNSTSRVAVPQTFRKFCHHLHALVLTLVTF